MPGPDLARRPIELPRYGAGPKDRLAHHIETHRYYTRAAQPCKRRGVFAAIGPVRNSVRFGSALIIAQTPGAQQRPQRRGQTRRATRDHRPRRADGRG